MTALDRKARILAVEDDPHIRILLTHLLRAHYDVEIVRCVDEALHAASDQRFDLFLLDINLREHYNGIDLLHALCRLPVYHNTPAIACTAYAMQGDQGRLLEEGFGGYVGKPFAREALIATIEAVLAETSRTDAEIHALPSVSALKASLHSVAA